MTATGEIVTYAELEDRSRRAANWLFDAGLRPGDVVGVSRFTLPHHVPLKSSK
ncbi:AMP-binding protein [Bradyrhizobium genosp. A]|uniref:AMP-binding protein n=1 Tax=Bradyrhizobium genosp. A TaxID=83626 RepID=UPI003CF5E78A